MRRGQYQHLSGDGSVQPGQFDTKRDKQLLKFIIITSPVKGSVLANSQGTITRNYCYISCSKAVVLEVEGT